MYCYSFVIRVALWILSKEMYRLVDGQMLYPEHDIDGTAGMVIFRFFGSKLSWNDARAHCQSIGGDLAKIPTLMTQNAVIKMAFENFGEDIFVQDYWTGLVEQLPGAHKWVSDCSLLHPDSLHNYESNFKTDESCFKMKRDTHWGDRKPCSEKHGFMCQVITTSPCPLTQRLSSGDWLPYNGTNCETHCSLQPFCWGALRRTGIAPPDDCVLIGLDGTGTNSVELNAKFCFNITRDFTVVPEAGDTSKIPNNNCLLGPVSTVSVPIVPPSTSYVTPGSGTVSVTPTSLFCPTLTENVTHTVNVTQNVTDYQTVFINITETAFHSEYITESDFYHHHHTHMVTVTMTTVHVQNISTDEIEEVAEEYVRNLTVDAKTTSSYIRSKTSVHDRRQSAQNMGIIGVLFVVLPMCLLIIMDVRKIVSNLRNYRGIYNH